MKSESIKRPYRGCISVALLTLGVVSSADAAPKPAPPHVSKSAGPYTSPGNASVPAPQLLPPATIASNANTVANRVRGIVKAVNLTTYGKYLSSMHRNDKDLSVSPDRQVYVVDVALPNGINSHGAAFGPNAEMHYVVDAASGKYISSLINGSRTDRNTHAR